MANDEVNPNIYNPLITSDYILPINRLHGVYFRIFEFYRVKLGTAGIIATTSNKFLLAKVLTALDTFSSGRLLLGIFLGGTPETYSILVGTSEKRVRHFLEFTDILKTICRGQSEKYRGEFWDFENLIMMPIPVQKPSPRYSSEVDILQH